MIILTVILACAAMAALAPRIHKWPLGAASALALVAVFSPAIWGQGLQAYPQDSYWTLSWFGRFGVLLISALGIAGFYAVLANIAQRCPTDLSRLIVVSLGGSIGFAIILTLAPQAFYTFYQFLFPGLPQQWVIAPNLTEILRVIAMPKDGNLSKHLSATAFWGVWPYAIWLWRKNLAD